MKMFDIVQTIFAKHIKGISFQEWNAGFNIDHNMKEHGFIV